MCGESDGLIVLSGLCTMVRACIGSCGEAELMSVVRLVLRVLAGDETVPKYHRSTRCFGSSFMKGAMRCFSSTCCAACRADVRCTDAGCMPVMGRVSELWALGCAIFPFAASWSTGTCGCQGRVCWCPGLALSCHAIATGD